MRFYLLHNDRQASWVKITLISKLNPKQRGYNYIALQIIISNASDQEKRKEHKEGSAEGHRMTLTGSSKLPCPFKVNLHLMFT
jgi:hypothetical protein